MLNKKINFLEATNGKIKVSVGPATRTSGTVKGLVNILKQYGLRPTIQHSSSMDFANEYGFKNNSDAWNLWNLSVKTYSKETNQNWEMILWT